MSVTVREIEEGDYPALLPLWNDELGNRHVTAENIARHCDRVKGDGRYKTFVALIGDEVVGFISSAQSFAVGFEGCFMQIIGIAVKREKQGMGIGKMLVGRMESFAKEQGCYHIGLNSGEKRKDAHAFFRRSGYTTDSLCFGKAL